MPANRCLDLGSQIASRDLLAEALQLGIDEGAVDLDGEGLLL